MNLHHVGNARDAKLERSNQDPPFNGQIVAGFAASGIHPFVQQTSFRSVSVLSPDLIVVNERTLSRAVQEMLKSRKRDQFVLTVHEAEVFRQFSEPFDDLHTHR